MTGLFSTAASLLDRRQLTAVWLPVLGLVGALVGLVVAAQGRAPSLSWWNSLGGEGQLMAVGAVVVVTVLAGQVLSARRVSLVRVYEGYWPDVTPIAGLRRQLLERHLQRHGTRTADAPDIYLGYPRHAGDVMPTRLGNTLRAAELHAQRYGIADPVSAWPRLYVVLPEQFTTAFAAAATNLEAAVTISFLGAVFAVLGGVLGVALLPWWGAALCIWAGCLVAVGGYRAAARAAVPYAQLIRTAFDVHRFQLLESMHLELPTDFAAERAQWEQLGKIWYLGWPDPHRASLLRYPGGIRTTAEPNSPEPPEGTTTSPARAPDPRRVRRALPVRFAAAVLVLLLGGVAALVADYVRNDRKHPAAARPIGSFHLLTAGDVRPGGRGKAEVDKLVGRYTLRPVAEGRPLLTRDLGPKLPGGLAGRELLTLPVAGRTAERGAVITVVVVPAPPEAPSKAQPVRVTDVIVLDLSGNTAVLAVPGARVTDLLTAATGGSVYLVNRPA